MQDYWRDHILSASKVTEEEPLRELLPPRDATTRLCFFSLPLDLLAVYRDVVFPTFESAGLVPVTTDDVISPGDSIRAKIDMLIDRASVMVVDFSSVWTRAEYQMALARLREAPSNAPHRKQLRLIVIVGNGEDIPREDRDRVEVILRPNLLTDDPVPFLKNLLNTLQVVDLQAAGEQLDEPRRLVEAREYRAAVIAAMSLLEGQLRRHLNKKQWQAVRNPLSMLGLLKEALATNIFTREESEMIHSWIRMRNEIVHSSREISSAQANDIVDGIDTLLPRL